MTAFLDKLNLRPTEKRLVVAVGLVLFIVLNLWLVQPHFKDWARIRAQMQKSRETLTTYQSEVARMDQHEAKLKKLEGQGSHVLPAEQAIQLLRTVQIQAPRSGVYVSSSRPVPNMSGKTNAFFDEQTVVISVNTGDKELVSFLYTIGSDNSMIRVRDLDLKPDTSGNKLQGSLTLVASFQRKPPTVAPAVASKTNNATVTRPQATNSQRSTGPRTNNLVAPKPMR